MTPFFETEASKKLSLGLRAELEALERRRAIDDPVRVLGKFSAAPSQADRDRIAALGVRLDSVIGTRFTATGPAHAIADLASLPVVVRLEKPNTMGTRPPKIEP